jgi:P27 family predicted phage terminase small subunit
MRRKSTPQKKTEGTYRQDRERNSPQFVATSGAKAPSYVRQNRLAYEEWKRVVPILEAEEILRETDLTLLASYCVMYARWRSAAEDIESRGQVLTITSTTRTGKTEKPVPNPSVRNEIAYAQAMTRIAVRFGMSPRDRESIPSSPFEGPNELEMFINAGLSDTHNFSADE